MNQQIPIKVYHKDLLRLGIVTSRYDQHQKIKSGKLRPPNKDANSMQAPAWWWWEDIAADLAREREATSSKQRAA
jgi:hypothetical protein